MQSDDTIRSMTNAVEEAVENGPKDTDVVIEEEDLLNWDDKDELELVPAFTAEEEEDIGLEAAEEPESDDDEDDYVNSQLVQQKLNMGGKVVKEERSDATTQDSTKIKTQLEAANGDGSGTELAPKAIHHKHTSLNHALLGASLAKAGQEGVNQKDIAQKVYEATVGSTFFKNEERRDEELTRQIHLLLAKKADLGEVGYQRHLHTADVYIKEMEATRDLTQVVATVDCDAFYASVEELDRPELKEVPFAVGGGVLTTANYLARKFGVRSGMAEHVAMKLCPQLLVLKPDFVKYIAKAREVRAVMSEYDDRMEASSIDEAHLNITEYCEVTGRDPEEVVNELRARVLKETKVSVSAGIAPNDTIAKIASNTNKPNGQFRVGNTREECMAFMADLPCRKVTGIGRVFERQLDILGVKVCGDIYKQRGWLHALCTEKEFHFLIKVYLGLGRSFFEPASNAERKSVGTESTFRAIKGSRAYREKLMSTAKILERYCISANAFGRTLILRIKLADFTSHTRQRQLGFGCYKAEDLYKLAVPLLRGFEDQWGKNFKCRLLGLRVRDLCPIVKPVLKFSDLGKTKIAVKRGQMEYGQIPKISEEHFKDCPQQRQSLRKPAPPPKKQWECMICAKLIDVEDDENDKVNEHLDFCLNKGAIMETVRNALEPDPIRKAPSIPQSSKSGTPPPVFEKPKTAGKRKRGVVESDGRTRKLNEFFFKA